MADKDESEKTIAEDLVVTKYKMAGDIVNRILKQVIDACVPEASVRQVCEYGDSLLSEETSKVFKKEKDLRKGIAFPTCISVNNCICHYSPLESEPEQVTLKEGDVVKVDLGAHIDGLIAVVAHTIIVGAKPSEKITGRKADAMLAAHYASQAALRLLKPGNQTYAITEAVQKVCESFKCKPVEGMLSHQLKQGKIDGEKTIIQNPTDAQKKEHEKFEFETHEVYAMDVLVSTGEGVGREMNTRVSVYKKTDETYQLKLKASRFFYSEVRDKHGSMPFTLRSFADEKKARMGVNECVSHKLIEPFHVLYEKPSELVVQFKFTVLLMPNGPHKITGLPFETENFQSEHSIEDPELKRDVKFGAFPDLSMKDEATKITCGRWYISLGRFAVYLQGVPAGEDGTYMGDVPWPNVQNSILAKYYGNATGEVAAGKCAEIKDTIDSHSTAVEGSSGVSMERPAKAVRKRKKSSEPPTNNKEDVVRNESFDSAYTYKNDSGQNTATQSKRQRKAKSAITSGSEEAHTSKPRDKYALKREILKLELEKTRLQIRLMEMKLGMARSGFSRAVPEELVEVTTNAID